MSETRRKGQVGGQRSLHSHYYLRLGLWWVEGLQNKIILAKQEPEHDVVNAVVDAVELLERFVVVDDVELKNDDHPD